jgi:hypothetical protein
MRLMSSLHWLCLIPLCVWSVGCSPDIKQVADAMVTDDFLKKGTQVAAIPFFEQGGRYFDEDASTKVDREIVLPLLQKLYATSHTQQWVVPDERDPKQAFAVLIELPADEAVVDAMAKAVEAADAQFDGMIVQQWGHRWLSIDLMDKETMEFFKKTDPELEKQR